jgi:hypothetical protein
MPEPLQSPPGAVCKLAISQLMDLPVELEQMALLRLLLVKQQVASMD